MKQKLVLSFFLSVFINAGFSQSFKAENLTVRWNLPGVFDVFDNNFTPGVEYRFNSTWSAGLDAGYIFASGYIRDNKGTSGILLRPFARFYTNSRLSIFLQGELHYKRVGYKIEDWLGRAPVNGTPAYEEFTTFRFIKKAAGAHFKIGRQLFLTRDERLSSEFTIGFGIRFKDTFVRDGVYVVPDFLGLNNAATNQALPVIPMGLNICYQLK